MNLSRRDFVLMAAGAVLATGEQAAWADDGQEVIDAGPVSDYAHDGVFDAFRDQGFFVIRKGGKLTALSSYCTHRRTKIKAEPDCSFYCPRHGSTFTPSGHPTKGPATRDLPGLQTAVNAAGHLLVVIPAVLT